MVGDPDGLAEQAPAYPRRGHRGPHGRLIGDVHDLETVALAGRTLGPVFA